MRFLIVPVLALAACAPGQQGSAGDTASASPRSCFMTDQVQNFRVGDNGHLYIRDIRDNVFDVDGITACFDLEAANSIAITPFGGGSQRVCEGDSVSLVVPRTHPGGSPCPARISRKLTVEEVAALPGRYRP